MNLPKSSITHCVRNLKQQQQQQKMNQIIVQKKKNTKHKQVHKRYIMIVGHMHTASKMIVERALHTKKEKRKRNLRKIGEQ